MNAIIFNGILVLKQSYRKRSTYLKLFQILKIGYSDYLQ